nr:uncharacterized protein LOC116279686 [Vicugna pacos]
MPGPGISAQQPGEDRAEGPRRRGDRGREAAESRVLAAFGFEGGTRDLLGASLGERVSPLPPFPRLTLPPSKVGPREGAGPLGRSRCAPKRARPAGLPFSALSPAPHARTTSASSPGEDRAPKPLSEARLWFVALGTSELSRRESGYRAQTTNWRSGSLVLPPLRCRARRSRHPSAGGVSGNCPAPPCPALPRPAPPDPSGTTQSLSARAETPGGGPPVPAQLASLGSSACRPAGQDCRAGEPRGARKKKPGSLHQEIFVEVRESHKTAKSRQQRWLWVCDRKIRGDGAPWTPAQRRPHHTPVCCNLRGERRVSSDDRLGLPVPRTLERSKAPSLWEGGRPRCHWLRPLAVSRAVP